MCIECVQAREQNCPWCRSASFTTILDKRTQRKDLYGLHVYCENNDCVWKGELGKLHRHLSNDCQYVIEKCRYGCGKYYYRHSLQLHEQEECPNRPLEAKINNNQTEVSPQVVMHTQENMNFHEMKRKRSVKTGDNCEL